MNPKNILNESNSQTPCIVIEGEFMKVNGKEIPYTKQMIQNNSFYLTDFGMDLPIEEGIKNFDQRYFQFMLNKQILKQLELLQPTMGLKLLQQMPFLTQSNFIAIFWRLSLAKTKQILMHNDFYVFLWQRFIYFMNKKSIKINDFDLTLLCNLDAPHKRLLYLLDYLPSSQPLRQAFYIITTEIIMPVLGCDDFILKLAQGQTEIQTESKKNKQVQNTLLSQSHKQLDRFFLRNVLDVSRTLITLSKMPQQIIQLCNVKNEREIMHILLNKHCLNLISLHFENLFDFDRNNLTKILSLIAMQKQHDLWNSVISRKQDQKNKIPQQNQAQPNANYKQNASDVVNSKGTAKFDQVQQTINNQDKFYMLIINNFYEIGQPQWDLTQIILESLITNSFNQSSYFLSKLLLELLNKDSSNSIQITIKFLIKTNSCQKFDRNQLKLFLIQLMAIIYSSIKYLYDQIKRDKNKILEPHKKKSSNTQLTITKPKQLLQCVSYLKIFTLLVKFKYIELLQDISYCKAIKKLMTITKNSIGLLQGVRRTFLKQSNIYIEEKKIDLHKYRFLQKKISTDHNKGNQSNCVLSQKIKLIVEFLKELS